MIFLPIITRTAVVFLTLARQASIGWLLDSLRLDNHKRSTQTGIKCLTEKVTPDKTRNKLEPESWRHYQVNYADEKKNMVWTSRGRKCVSTDHIHGRNLSEISMKWMDACKILFPFQPALIAQPHRFSAH